MEGFAWNIRVLKGQMDILSFSRKECSDWMRQVISKQEFSSGLEKFSSGNIWREGISGGKIPVTSVVWHTWFLRYFANDLIQKVTNYTAQYVSNYKKFPITLCSMSVSTVKYHLHCSVWLYRSKLPTTQSIVTLTKENYQLLCTAHYVPNYNELPITPCSMPLTSVTYRLPCRPVCPNYQLHCPVCPSVRSKFPISQPSVSQTTVNYQFHSLVFPKLQ